MVDKNKKFLVTPLNFFVISTIVVMIASALLSVFGVQTTGLKIGQTVTNDISSYVISINSMLSVSGIQYIISNAVDNFASFAPLTMLIIAMIGIGVAQKTEFLKTFFTVVTNKFSKKFLTFLVVFISVLGSVYINSAYVLLIPLSAILFMTNGRHPLIGVIASFAGTAGGYGVTAMVGSLDSSLSAYTSIAARLLDSEYGVTIWSNIFIMIIGTILISYVGMIVTEKITVPRIGKLKTDDDEIFIVDKLEKRALRYTLLVLILMILALLYALTPGFPKSGFLLDNTTVNYVNKLFGLESFFYKGGTLIFSTMLIICGTVYGVLAKTIKKHDHIVRGSIDDIGNIIILLFAASQFIAIFKQTNIGPLVTGLLTNLISDLNFSGLPLIILLLIAVIISNLLFTSPVGKWTIMSPVIVPMFMQANISPEFTQMVFRIGQSVTNGVTPLLAYFVVFVAFIDKYNTYKDKKVTVFGCIKYAMPYSIAFLGVWFFLLLTFYLIGIPIGVGANPTL